MTVNKTLLLGDGGGGAGREESEVNNGGHLPRP